MPFPRRSKLLNQHLEKRRVAPLCETTVLFLTSFMLYPQHSVIGGDASSIEAVTAPRADSDHIGTRSPPCPESRHNGCSTYRGDICPKGGYNLTAKSRELELILGSFPQAHVLSFPLVTRHSHLTKIAVTRPVCAEHADFDTSSSRFYFNF